ncbi:MAG: ATP-binding protein [Desulfomonilaceae bacterium]
MTGNSKPQDEKPVALRETLDINRENMNFWAEDSESVRAPISIFDKLLQLERFLPRYLKPKQGFLATFKNRILISALLVVTAVVTVIGVTLEFAVFPKLKGDSAIIDNLKVIHFLASLLVIAVSWLFIERISKIITTPLLQLTKRADQISREAGERFLNEHQGVITDYEGDIDVQDKGLRPSDEIGGLTRSFNRMLLHLKASESRLRESEEKYRFLFDNGPSPIFVIDAASMMILDVNARAQEEYCYSKNELLKMNFADLGLDRDREETSSKLKKLFATEVALFPVLQHRRKDGSLFMVNFQACTSRYQNRPAIIAAVWDVTERLEKRAKVIQAGKMATLGEMATGIAHELNQPLNVIMLGCDYLRKKIRTGESVTVEDLKQVTLEINSSVQRASRIINHLRQFGRKADETMSPVNINDPISNVFNLVGTQLEARGIKWQLILDDKLPMILGDVNRLEQVFINLILNARDAMLSTQVKLEEKLGHENKFVTIKSFVKDSRVVVTFSDTGPGVPESIVSKIFDPFFTTKKTGEGTGLGLSISYGIVKDHQGTIEVDPQIQKGATFRLTFPALPHGETK